MYIPFCSKATNQRGIFLRRKKNVGKLTNFLIATISFLFVVSEKYSTSFCFVTNVNKKYSFVATPRNTDISFHGESLRHAMPPGKIMYLKQINLYKLIQKK